MHDDGKYKAYSLGNFRDIPQMAGVSEDIKFDIEVVGHVLPFKTNNFVIDHLIDWSNAPEDPLFVLNFPQRGMLLPDHYAEISGLMKRGSAPAEIKEAADRIRLQLNPHPAGQISHNIPTLEGEPLDGMQHKYRETVLFFPSQGQTCHAYCSFCFRWPQFVGMSELKFASREADRLVAYLKANPQVTDVLFTGGDPLIMSARHLAEYIDPLLSADLPNLRRIRIGTKALSYWPYKFLSDDDAPDLLALFRRVGESGRHLALMAHFNHPRELEPEPVRQAIAQVRQTGAVIRTQSPLLCATSMTIPNCGAKCGTGRWISAACRITCSSPATPARSITSRCRWCGRGKSFVRPIKRSAACAAPHAAPACRPIPARCRCWASAKSGGRRSCSCASFRAATRIGCIGPSSRNLMKRPLG